MYKILLLLVASFFVSTGTYAQNEQPLLNAAADAQRHHIVFAYGGYLWSVDRKGGAAVAVHSKSMESIFCRGLLTLQPSMRQSSA